MKDFFAFLKSEKHAFKRYQQYTKYQLIKKNVFYMGALFYDMSWRFSYLWDKTRFSIDENFEI